MDLWYLEQKVEEMDWEGAWMKGMFYFNWGGGNMMYTCQNLSHWFIHFIVRKLHLRLIKMNEIEYILKLLNRLYIVWYHLYYIFPLLIFLDCIWQKLIYPKVIFGFVILI